MNTARDLAIAALTVLPDRLVEQGNLSLALAGAEVVDLIEARAVALDGDRIVPGAPAPTGDRLLDEAAASLVRQEPYESVEYWLWRRGQGLSATYVDDLERSGLTTRSRGRRIPLRTGRTELVDSPDRRRAEDRRASGEPVFAALATAAGLRDEPTEQHEDNDGPGNGVGLENSVGLESSEGPENSEGREDGEDLAGEAVTTVLAVVAGAVQELEAVRQRKTIEDAAFDNVWRGL
ncbi:GPP34 family phosphoprotein [Streptomyces sp. NBC_01275]|uniref:GOLPH3/VPS74 family protein n=1 Tax=Streptomyces sp. NBC_01275 TaxID=2903807 RepID=UPI00225194A3|nr:GPP34 family phosphoprotein [Streptomyces sp. NBC_01275]MCX4766449.1 GPP34 family phosphoprotein [Streptomyces sp. NBC_01275]